MRAILEHVAVGRCPSRTTGSSVAHWSTVTPASYVWTSCVPVSRRDRTARRRARSRTVPDEAREDAPFALGPLPEVALFEFEEALGVAPALAGTTASRNTSTCSPVTILRRPRPNTRSIWSGVIRSPCAARRWRVPGSAGRDAAEQHAAVAAARARRRAACVDASTVASSSLPPAREHDEPRAAARERRSPQLPATRGVTCLCMPSLQSTSISSSPSRRSRRWARRRRRCRSSARDRRASRPAAASGPVCRRYRRASAALRLVTRRGWVGAAITDPGDEPARQRVRSAHSATVAAPDAVV